MNKEEIAKMQEKYKLTEEEYEEYYKTVNGFFTTGKKKEDKPKLVFVAGQAGAGKSRLIPIVKEELKYNAVVSDYDVVRSLHPKYDIACKEVPQNVHFALLPDADRANEDLRHYCRDNSLNLIYEGTMRGTDVFVTIAKEFKDAGYEVDLSLMSVPKLESYGSTLLRYATDLHGDNPRWVPKEVHDQSYEKFVVTLKELSKQSLYDNAKVYKRGRDETGKPIQIYSSQRNEFQNPIEAVLYGREKYRLEAVLDYGVKHDLVYNIFQKEAPNLIGDLSDWEKLYDEERKRLQELDINNR